MVGEGDADRLGELAGTVAEIAVGAGRRAAFAHRLEAGGRLQGPHQHRRRDALGLADEVQQAVDAVGEVDVGAAWRAEEDAGALGEADVGVTGGVGLLVALGLDDRAADAAEEEAAANQLAGDSVDRAGKKIVTETGIRPPRSRPPDGVLAAQAAPASSRIAASRVQALSIWAASGAEPVPPAITFDSSQLERCRTA